MAYILALDQGTTSSRAILFDRDGHVRALAQQEFPQIFPAAGWVEHDPEAIWASQHAVAVEALRRGNISAKEIAAIAIANQRETTVIWNRRTRRAGLRYDRFLAALEADGRRASRDRCQ